MKSEGHAHAPFRLQQFDLITEGYQAGLVVSLFEIKIFIVINKAIYLAYNILL